MTTKADLLDAVQRIEGKFPGKNIVIEPYISGPEVDANFVLLNGKLLFSEINDDFPSAAEIPNGPPSTSFAEMSTIMPSMLPESELSILTSSLTKTLANLGFRNGVFHIEARVKGSRMQYEMKDSSLELAKRWGSDVEELPDPSSFLIEINVRTPGHQESFAVEYTYGIDYYAMYTLLALTPPTSKSSEDDIPFPHSELARLHAVSQSFPSHIQYPTNIVFIPVTKGGTFVSAKPLPKSLMQHVVYHRLMMQEGEFIEDPEVSSKWPFVAYFLVQAKMAGEDGREQVRALGERVREAFVYEVA